MADDGEEEIGMLCSHDEIEISQSGRLNWCNYISVYNASLTYTDSLAFLMLF